MKNKDGVSKWISVKERRPPFSTKVLVMMERIMAGKKCTNIAISFHRGRPNEWFVSHPWEIKYEKIPFDVTHWMSLPSQKYRG